MRRILTRKQREALKRVYDRSELYVNDLGQITSVSRIGSLHHYGPLSYRNFRKKVVPFDYGAIGIQWCGMWLGIETDGYTHS